MTAMANLRCLMVQFTKATSSVAHVMAGVVIGCMIPRLRRCFCDTCWQSLPSRYDALRAVAVCPTLALASTTTASGHMVNGTATGRCGSETAPCFEGSGTAMSLPSPSLRCAEGATPCACIPMLSLCLCTCSVALSPVYSSMPLFCCIVQYQHAFSPSLGHQPILNMCAR